MASLIPVTGIVIFIIALNTYARWIENNGHRPEKVTPAHT